MCVRISFIPYWSSILSLRLYNVQMHDVCMVCVLVFEVTNTNLCMPNDSHTHTHTFMHASVCVCAFEHVRVWFVYWYNCVFASVRVRTCWCQCVRVCTFVFFLLSATKYCTVLNMWCGSWHTPATATWDVRAYVCSHAHMNRVHLDFGENFFPFLLSHIAGKRAHFAYPICFSNAKAYVSVLLVQIFYTTLLWLFFFFFQI